MHSARLTEVIIGCAIKVHKALGPGLLESTYEACLAYELGKQTIRFERQFPIPVRYESVILDCGYRADLIVENQVIVELKAVAKLDAIHTAQLITQMKLSGISIGLLINFNVLYLPQGLKRYVL